MDQAYFFWQRVSTWCYQHTSTLDEWWIVEKPMLHWFQQLRATMKATFVNLHWDFPTPLIYCHNLKYDWPKKGNLFLCLSFVPNDIPLRGSAWGISSCHLCKFNFLKTSCLIIQYFPILAEYPKKGVTSGRHKRAWSKSNWSNFPKNKLNLVWLLHLGRLSTMIHVG